MFHHIICLDGCLPAEGKVKTVLQHTSSLLLLLLLVIRTLSSSVQVLYSRAKKKGATAAKRPKAAFPAPEDCTMELLGWLAELAPVDDGLLGWGTVPLFWGAGREEKPVGEAAPAPESEPADGYGAAPVAAAPVGLGATTEPWGLLAVAVG